MHGDRVIVLIFFGFLIPGSDVKGPSSKPLYDHQTFQVPKMEVRKPI